MARPLRIEYHGAFYHITSRGNERKDIFKTQKDREQFLSYLESATERYGAVIHIYCLMNNHYHLVLQTPLGNLSQIMRYINGSYTTYYNIKKQRAGHLLQGRYKAILVEMDAYAQELSRYIHLNPVRSGVVKKADEYPWSSYRYYIRADRKPAWLQTEFILNYFNKDITRAQKEYQRFVEALGGKAYESPLNGVIGSTMLGNDDFINDIKERHLNHKRTNRDVPALKEFADRPTIDQIAAEVEKVFGNEPALSRRIKLYLCHRYTGKRLKDIGEYFKVTESGVSQARHRVAVALEKDKKLSVIVEKIKQKINLPRV
jgi:REP element-mobilizing transposase RayT